MRWPLGNEVFHPLGDRLADPRAAAGPDRGRGGGANAHSFGIWDFEKGSAGPLGGGSVAFARLPLLLFCRSGPGMVALRISPSPPSVTDWKKRLHFPEWLAYHREWI